MSSGNEIIFFGDGNSRSQSLIVYNVISKEYTILSDDQNYKSIDVTPYKHCVFKRNDISFESGGIERKQKEKDMRDKYISLDDKHFSIYKYDGKNSHSMKKFTIINKMNTDIEILSNAMCCSLFNRKGMCVCIILHDI